MRFDSLGNICTTVTDYVANGSFKALKENVSHKNAQDGYAILIRLADYRNKFKGPFEYIDRHGYNFLSKTKLYGNEIIISNVGAHLGTVFRTPTLGTPMSLGPNAILLKTKYIDDYYYYFFTSKKGQALLKTIVSGSAQPKFNKTDLKKLIVPIPSLDEQNKISRKLLAIDKKIQINEQINANLLELAKTLFSEEFSSNEEVLLSNYLLPKRGKNLLKKNVVSGEFPVIAGGLKPAAFHNSYNTKAPVITISASGANAGYVQIWGQPVWSSDSSYIDTSITKDIYFWYLLLKKYQKQIFDAQTGSAQPHIYPKHIGNLLIPNISEDSIKNFNITITPIFKKIFQNKNENNKLKAIKNSLLIKYFN